MLERAGCVHLREQGRIGTTLRILCALDFHVCHFHRNILRKGYLERILQGEDKRRIFLRGRLFHILCRRQNGDGEQKHY